MSKSVIVMLMGGLGNQLFQYAAGRALALNNNSNLFVDRHSGFIRDKVFKRLFSLAKYQIKAKMADFVMQLPFIFERTINAFSKHNIAAIQRRMWGHYIFESKLECMNEVCDFRTNGNVWMCGYWQSESYFSEYKHKIFSELYPLIPSESSYLSMARNIESCNSVSLGVRLFEEVPGTDKSGVGGITPFSYYVEASRKIASKVNNPTFFVFCTSSEPVIGKLELPGPVHYITHDNGFNGADQRLWLMSRCRHHIISNSSFYWWGAWFSEYMNRDNVIVACDMFPNRDSVPLRWIKQTAIS